MWMEGLETTTQGKVTTTERMSNTIEKGRIDDKDAYGSCGYE